MASRLPGDDEDPSPLVGGADLRRSEDTDRCLVTQALKVCADLVCSSRQMPCHVLDDDSGGAELDDQPPSIWP